MASGSKDASIVSEVVGAGDCVNQSSYDVDRQTFIQEPGSISHDYMNDAGQLDKPDEGDNVKDGNRVNFALSHGTMPVDFQPDAERREVAI